MTPAQRPGMHRYRAQQCVPQGIKRSILPKRASFESNNFANFSITADLSRARKYPPPPPSLDLERTCHGESAKTPGSAGESSVKRNFLGASITVKFYSNRYAVFSPHLQDLSLGAHLLHLDWFLRIMAATRFILGQTNLDKCIATDESISRGSLACVLHILQNRIFTIS